jgi:hypothetical protein
LCHFAIELFLRFRYYYIGDIKNGHGNLYFTTAANKKTLCTFETTLILQISGGQNNIQWALPSIKHEKKSIKKI